MCKAFCYLGWLENLRTSSLSKHLLNAILESVTYRNVIRKETVHNNYRPWVEPISFKRMHNVRSHLKWGVCVTEGGQ